MCVVAGLWLLQLFCAQPVLNKPMLGTDVFSLSPSGYLVILTNHTFMVTLAGHEPAIPWFAVRCLIRWATGPLAVYSFKYHNLNWNVSVPVAMWLVGLGVWFSLRVREVPGSNPGRALFYHVLDTTLDILFICFKSNYIHVWGPGSDGRLLSFTSIIMKWKSPLESFFITAKTN